MYERCSFLNENTSNSHNFRSNPNRDHASRIDGLFQECRAPLTIECSSGRVDCEMELFVAGSRSASYLEPLSLALP